jgi:hypothetical protein
MKVAVVGTGLVADLSRMGQHSVVSPSTHTEHKTLTAQARADEVSAGRQRDWLETSCPPAWEQSVKHFSSFFYSW